MDHNNRLEKALIHTGTVSIATETDRMQEGGDELKFLLFAVWSAPLMILNNLFSSALPVPG